MGGELGRKKGTETLAGGRATTQANEAVYALDYGKNERIICAMALQENIPYPRPGSLLQPIRREAKRPTSRGANPTSRKRGGRFTRQETLRYRAGQLSKANSASTRGEGSLLLVVNFPGQLG